MASFSEGTGYRRGPFAPNALEGLRQQQRCWGFASSQSHGNISSFQDVGECNGGGSLRVCSLIVRLLAVDALCGLARTLVGTSRAHLRTGLCLESPAPNPSATGDDISTRAGPYGHDSRRNQTAIEAAIAARGSVPAVGLSALAACSEARRRLLTPLSSSARGCALEARCDRARTLLLHALEVAAALDEGSDLLSASVQLELSLVLLVRGDAAAAKVTRPLITH